MRVENGERVHLGTGPSRKDVWLEGMQAQAAGRMGPGQGPGSREARGMLGTTVTRSVGQGRRKCISQD